MISETSDTDIDVAETQEWLTALQNILQQEGLARAKFILDKLASSATQAGIDFNTGIHTPYKNTIAPQQEDKMPSDEGVMTRISALIRWNAVAMVLKAGKKAAEIGGHIATYASAATLYDIGFNHFFRAASDEHDGDLIYIQGHSSPGIYARAFLEGRLSAQQLANFRQEIDKDGLTSYPHPWLMPEFWQFPTVSMGLGPLQAIYQARFLKYMENRGHLQANNRKVWAFLGDGETDEVESLGAISIAARERLDNLIFVINCNLQRLDGPVRGNGKIIQELEGIFKGAGWKVIKVIWGSRWDALLAKDSQGLLQRRMEECVDGDYQSYKAHDGAYVRQHFFGHYPDLLKMVENLSDDDIWRLNRGGHDPQKVYAAYSAAMQSKGQPTVILAKTVKGYGMGAAGEGQNITHQQKKMTLEHLKVFRDRFNIPVSDENISEIPFYRPAKDSVEIQYLQKQRHQLGGYLPARRTTSVSLTTPDLAEFATLLAGSGERDISTTMVFVRILNILLKNKQLTSKIVPIVPDECRTFGMEGLFRQVGIYSPVGQLYTPVDHDQVMYYKEAKDGQILEEGITEAGAFCSWIAAATSYSTNNVPMIPFYIFYSMFGFQRIGDLAWAAGDAQARGFLLGGTAGRTTLAGEGLQHQDGHSLLLASTIPNCLSYDPTFGYELAVIICDGLRRMYQQQQNIFYYITLMNENYQHPVMPEGAEIGIIKGLYLFKAPSANPLTVQLIGSGTILREAIQAAKILQQEFNIAAAIWSATSFNELKREAQDCERYNRLHPEATPKIPYVSQCLAATEGPIIAVTDYVSLYADQIRAYVPRRYVTLGTDGYGRSDTREQLRHHFEVDAKYIVITVLKALADEGALELSQVTSALTHYNINPDKPNPLLA